MLAWVGFLSLFTVATLCIVVILRRQWIGLRLQQNFEDLLCLPSLHGVDPYIYQQETVRRVLAEEVVQTVFIDLGRQARALSKDVMLGGWLHRHTCFVAARTMRSNRRRQ